MASRVNVKFVILLATALVLVAAGTVFVAVQVVFKSAADLAARGDAAMADGEINAARLLYSKAVNKDPFNSEFLLKWRESLRQWTPETDRELQTQFSTTYRQLCYQLARSDNMSHPDYQIEYLELLRGWLRDQPFDRAQYEGLATEARQFIEAGGAATAGAPELVRLRRFRGLALAQIAQRGLDLTQQQQEEFEADLAAAIAADPADYEVFEGQLLTLLSRAQRAEAAGRLTEAERFRAELDGLMSSFLDRNGAASLPGVLASMMREQIGFRLASRRTMDELGDAALPELERMADEYQQKTERLAGMLASLDPAQVTAMVIQRLYSLETVTDKSAQYRATLPLLEAAAARTPEDGTLSILYGNILLTTDQFEKAIGVLQEVVDRPRLPLGLAGFQRISDRVQAANSIVECCIRAHAAGPEAEKPAWIARGKEARANLGALVPEGMVGLQFLDAKFAIEEGDLASAQRLLDAYNKATNSQSLDALWLTAQVAIRLQQPGKARMSLERFLEVRPGDAAAHTALADVELTLNRPDAALAHLREAQKSHPDDPAIQARIAQIEVMIDPSKERDPIRRAILGARRLAMGTETEIADPAAAGESLRAALKELGDDPRLYSELVRLELMLGNTTAATEAMASALAAFPGDESLESLEAAVTAAGSVEGQVQWILDSQEPEVRKQLSIYRVYLLAEREAEAVEALRAAEAAAPDDPAVIELLFARALAVRDVEAARALAGRAATANTDRIGGLGYRARLLLLEGRDQEALTALNQAVAQSPNDTQLLRTLASLQLSQGQAADGLASYARALAIRPGDVGLIMEYCASLAELQRYAEALEVARRSASSARRNPMFVELLLRLEAEAGDRQSARAQREKILAARPDDLGNRHELISLYISLGERDAAMGLLQQTRERFGLSPALVQLEARWYAEGNELEKARRVFARDVAETPPADRAAKLIALAQFMMKQGQPGQGITALRQAVDYEPAGTHQVRSMLASSLMQYGQNTEAASLLRSLLTAGADTADHRLLLQTVEALAGSDRLSEAERLLSSVPAEETGITGALLRARIALRRGSDRDARSMLDNAVSRWPQDYRVWVLRAEAESGVPELQADALADIDRSIALRPDLSELHRRKAELLAKMGREDEALVAWREAVRLNPALEELRAALLVTMVRRGMEREATEAAAEWFALRPRDIGLRQRVAELFLSGEMPHLAIETYKGALQIEPQAQVLLRLVGLLLADTPPRTTEAEQALADARALVLADPTLLLARARVFALTNRQDAARNDAMTSYRMVPPRAEAMTQWYSTMLPVFGDRQQTLAFFRNLQDGGGSPGWGNLFAARALVETPATEAAGRAELESVARTTRNPEVKYGALRVLSGARYVAGDYEGAIAAWTETLQMRPNDWQVENNMAYTLAVQLGRPAEALPYAEAATVHGPDQPEVHDTLGAVYLALGRPQDAIGPLTAAVEATRGMANNIFYMVRLASARLETGDREGAEDLVVQIESSLDAGLKLDDQYQAMLGKVRERLGRE